MEQTRCLTLVFLFFSSGEYGCIEVCYGQKLLRQSIPISYSFHYSGSVSFYAPVNPYNHFRYCSTDYCNNELTALICNPPPPNLIQTGFVTFKVYNYLWCGGSYCSYCSDPTIKPNSFETYALGKCMNYASDGTTSTAVSKFVMFQTANTTAVVQQIFATTDSTCSQQVLINSTMYLFNADFIKNGGYCGPYNEKVSGLLHAYYSTSLDLNQVPSGSQVTRYLYIVNS